MNRQRVRYHLVTLAICACVMAFFIGVSNMTVLVELTKYEVGLTFVRGLHFFSIVTNSTIFQMCFAVWLLKSGLNSYRARKPLIVWVPLEPITSKELFEVLL